MKRFLSLVLSALFVFQLGNASCDAASHYRSSAQNYNMGATTQGQPVIVMQPSPYIPQQQPIINVTAPEPTPQQHNITINPPTIHQDLKMKVDATPTGDKIAGWLRTVFYLLLAALGSVVIYHLWPTIKLVWGTLKLVSGGVSWINSGISSVVATFAKWGDSLKNVFSFSA